MHPFSRLTETQRHAASSLALGRGKQCQLLRDIVDDRRSAPLATVVSRRTAALVDQVKSYGDLGQHLDDSVDGSVAIAACFAALEMCDSLARDLK